MTKPTASTIINYSPRKSRLVINAIRGQNLNTAMNNLKGMNKGKTKKFFDLLLSAANNMKLTAEEYGQYFVNEIVAEEAQRLYRQVPRARGGSARIRRRYARIKVSLTSLTNK
jgi:ribosomal protein L22